MNKQETIEYDLYRHGRERVRQALVDMSETMQDADIPAADIMTNIAIIHLEALTRLCLLAGLSPQQAAQKLHDALVRL
ncbi:MAG TPA: hypothetical protein VLL28_08985, partial [Hyphomicrobiaceae bacterium]|nr:hypothetical protein [Hyphomicrobiaceae bacterium]